MGGCALDGQFSLAEALKTYQLVGHETVGYRQRETGHGEEGVDVSVALIGAVQQSEFFVVEHQTGLDGMGVVLLHQIHQLRTDIADGRTLEGHVLYGHIRGHGDMLVAVLQDMVVALQIAGDTGHIGEYGCQFAEV